MKTLSLFSLCICLVANACTTNDSSKTAQTQQSTAVIENIEAAQFKKLIDSGDGIILDVRTPEEVSNGYIKGASTINFYDEDFESKINFMQKDKPVYVYCRSGGRSSKAAELMQKNGFKKIYNLTGGITAWEESGFEIVKPEGTKDENIQQLSLDAFNKLLKTELPVLVDFHTLWCVPCRKMAPVVDKISSDLKGKAEVLRIDIDKSKDIAKQYQIQGVPVFILFINGKEKWRHSGIIADEELRKVITENSK